MLKLREIRCGLSLGTIIELLITMKCASTKLQVEPTPSEFASSEQCVHSPTVARRTRQLGPAIGKRLRLAKNAKDLTVRELAKLAHTSPNTIQVISNGEGGNSSVGLLADIAKALGVTPEWLAYGAGPGPE